MIQHPAKYSDILLPYFAKYLQGYNCILDPMAGTGKIAEIINHGWNGNMIYCNELEHEWTKKQYNGIIWSFGDAAKMDWFHDEYFDAICTSPTYGNRLADHWLRKDTSKRFSYTFNLGHVLNPENTGKMHWGKIYQQKHEAIWKECKRVLRQNGRLIVNVSDHIRNKQLINVVSWHRNNILSLGFRLIYEIPITTHRLRYGRNHTSRVNVEWILIFQKEAY